MKQTTKPRMNQGKSTTTQATNKDTLNLQIGSWNVQTLNKPGGLRILADALLRSKMDITAIQETRWPGKDVAKYNNYDFYFSGGGTKSFGTGFLVTGKTRKAVMEFNPVSDKMCTVRIRAKFFNITIINAHAPTEVKDDESKTLFYESLQKLLDKTPRHDIKIVLGDFNAQVGREEMYRPTIGKHSLHEISNTNGCRMIDFAVMNNLVIKSTYFRHLNIHKATWTSPGDRCSNQIDHVMIDGRHSSSIMDVRTLRGPNVDSDHFLVRAKLRARVAVPRNKQPDPRRFDIDRLKQDSVQAEYGLKIEGAIIQDLQHQTGSVDEGWNRLREIIKTVATEVVGWKGKQPRNDWFDDECQRALNDKNEARKKSLLSKTRASREIYKEKRTAGRILFKRKKAEKEKVMVDRIQSLEGIENSRERYRQIKRIRENFNHQPLLCRSADGNVLADEEQCIARWAEYFKELLNQNVVVGQNPRGLPGPALLRGTTSLAQDAADAQEPSLDEVRAVIGSLKNNKSTGSDNIPAELFKYGGEALYQHMQDILVNIWREEVLPNEWKLGVICPLYKKGDKLDCTNYRGITLLNVAYKILANLLYQRLKTHAESQIGEYQCGFRKDRSTSDQLFSIRQILEKCKEFNVSTHHLFVDFKAAYDSVLREKLWHVMAEFGFHPKLISMTKLTLSNVIAKVRVRDKLSEAFCTEEGLRQGDPLSTLLFNIALESAVRNSKVETEGTIYFKSVQLLAYADDIDVIGRSLNEVKTTFMNLESHAKHMGLSVNIAKTKYMHVTTREDPNVQFQLMNGDERVEFDKVSNFIYLGSQVNSGNDIGEEIRRRITQGNRSFYSLSKFFRSKTIRTSLKCVIYRSLVRPVVTYGSEAWCLSKKDEQSLQVFERRILRSIFGAIQENGQWRSRYNHELYQLYKDQEIVSFIKVNRLRWLGHVERMDDRRVPKRLFKTNPQGTRGRGRPGNRWVDSVCKDLERLGIPDWQTLSRNRDRWRSMLQEAKTARL